MRNTRTANFSGNGTVNKNQATREIVPVGLDLSLKYGLSGENPDSLIASKGWDYIESLEKDTHLASVLATRRQKLIEKGWKIEPHVSENGKVTARNQDIADFVNFCVDEMHGTIEKDIEGMLDALGKGFSLSEINYRYLNRSKFKGKLGLGSIRFKPAKYWSFDFDKYGHWTIRQIDPDPTGVPMPAEKFIHLISGFNDENPYGEGLTAKCAFWVWLKKNQAKFWAIFNERFGMPVVKIEVPRNVTDPEMSKARNIIQDIATRAGIVVPENFDGSFMEAMRNGDVTYGNFIELCNKEISKVVLGATLISEEGKRGQGSYALSTTHSNVMETYTLFDSVIVANAINEQLIRRLVDFNYVTDVYPRFKWAGVSVSSLISVAQSLGQLAQNGVTDIPLRWVHEQTGIPIAREGEPVLAMPKPVAQGSAAVAPGGTDNRSKDFRESHATQFAKLPEEVQAEVDAADRIKSDSMQQFEARMADMFDNIANPPKKKSKASLLEWFDGALAGFDNSVNVFFENGVLSDLTGRYLAMQAMARKRARFFSEYKRLKTKDKIFEEIPSAYDEAIAFFIRKGVITKDEFIQLTADARRKAFTIAADSREYVLNRVKEMLEAFLSAGGTIEDFRAQMGAFFEKTGVTPKNPHYLDLVFQNNIQESFARGKDVIYEQADRAEFPFRQLLTVGDDRVRKEHADIDGFTAPVDDPIWNRLRVPLAHGCRCSITLVHVDEGLTPTDPVNYPSLTGRGFEFVN